MARYISTQYANNKPANQRNGKGDKDKGDDPKSEDKNSNTHDTVGAHVEDTTTTEESTTPSGAASIGAHVLEKCSVVPSTMYCGKYFRRTPNE